MDISSVLSPTTAARVTDGQEDDADGTSAGAEAEAEAEAKAKLAQLATHIIRSCPRLHLVGLMTIGKPDGGEGDFVALREARDRLVRVLLPLDEGVWGESEGEGEGEDGGLDSSQGGKGDGERKEKTHARMCGRRLLLSMGMSHDLELALRAGADVVRVGTGIFGARPPRKGAQ